jgi:DNA-binding transcriptional LysR family regulator
MELRHLRYFIAAAEEEHFGRASDRLHVTRPAVSQIIADLEDEIGTPLFERLAHRVRLTEAGKTLLPQVRSILNQLSEAILLTQRVGQGKSGSLSIGYGSLTLLNTIFRAAIKQYKETYPEVTLALHEISTTDQFRALADGTIDAGFMHFGPGRVKVRKGPGSTMMRQDETVLDWFHIQTGALGVALPTDHRLAQRKAVTLADLSGERFVVVPQSVSSPGYGPLYALCQEAGFEPNVVQEVKTISTQLNLISVGVGIGLAVTGRNFVYPHGITVVPLEKVAHSTSFVFAWVKDSMDPALERLLDIVKVLAK